MERKTPMNVLLQYPYFKNHFTNQTLIALL